MRLSEKEKTLLEAIRVLRNSEIKRVQRHLVSRKKMTAFDFGWDDPSLPADRGCLIGVAMSEEMMGKRSEQSPKNDAALTELIGSFDTWARHYISSSEKNLLAAPRKRLATLLDMEWQRRHPVVIDLSAERKEARVR